MHVFDLRLLTAMWTVWALYWWIASVHTKAVARRESIGSRVSYAVPLVFAGLLLWFPIVPMLDGRALAAAPGVFWAGAGITAGGLLFAVWARLCLGGNWSGTVTIKEHHELVARGPYAIVRHPIYSGILLGFAGTAVAQGRWAGVPAVALAGWALWRKLRIEEDWLGREFGAAYADYRRRIRALIPFIL